MPQIRRYTNGAERQRAYRQRHKPPAIAPETGNPQPVRLIPEAPSIRNIPAHARWIALVNHSDSALRTAHAEMESYYDNRSEFWQEDQRGEDFKEKVEALEELLESMEQLVSEHFSVTAGKRS